MSVVCGSEQFPHAEALLISRIWLYQPPIQTISKMCAAGSMSGQKLLGLRDEIEQHLIDRTELGHGRPKE